MFADDYGEGDGGGGGEEEKGEKRRNMTNHLERES